MKPFGITALLFVFATAASGQQLTTKELLSGNTWEIKAKSEAGGSPKESEQYHFQQDGKYLVEAGQTKMAGIWSWTKDDEVLIEVTSMVMGGETYKFEKASKYFIRVLELTPTKLRTLERLEKETWEAAKERNYTLPI